MKKLNTAYCYQVHYIDKEIHKFELIDFTDKYIKFKWKQDKRYHKATVYHSNSNEKWFKTEKEAREFISNQYDLFFKNAKTF